jgi:putative NIF3 family GTP cyclohydrolase 1 type 2
VSILEAKMSRRVFNQSAAMAAAAGALHPLGFAQPSSQPTAAQVVETIKQHLNMTWNYKSYRDTFKAGDPNTPVKAIASCFMSTLDVLQRAHTQGLNFVISHEPTFWSDADLIEPIKKDALYLEKLHFVESNNMVIWRIHDHWHRFRPEPMTTGNEDLLGWTKNPSDPRLYQFNPPIKLRAIAEQLATKLYTRSVRFIGDPDMLVTNLSRGGHALSATIGGLDIAEACFSSEMREWESAEYVRELINSGEKKGYIVLSHEASEEQGMARFTDFMKTAVPDLKTVFVPTNDRMYFA